MPSWKHADLTALSGSPDAQGRPFAYLTHDGSNPTPRVLYRGSENHIHELRLDGDWKKADLSAIAGAPDAASHPFAYNTGEKGGSTPRVIYRGQDGHIHELRLEGDWKKADLTQLAKSAGAQGNPSAGASVVGGRTVARVVFRAEDGHIHEIRLEDDYWQSADLTDLSDAPSASGDPFLYVTGNGNDETVRVLYVSSDRHLHELRLEPGSPWKQADLTALAGAPGASSGPFAYLDGERPRIVYRSADNHIQEVRLESGSWKKGDLMTLAGAEAAEGQPSAYAVHGTPRMVYRGESAHVLELRLEDGSWKKGDLSDLASAPPADGDPIGYRLPAGSTVIPRVLYRGSDGHVHELRLE